MNYSVPRSQQHSSLYQASNASRQCPTNENGANSSGNPKIQHGGVAHRMWNSMQRNEMSKNPGLDARNEDWVSLPIWFA